MIIIELIMSSKSYYEQRTMNKELWTIIYDLDTKRDYVDIDAA